MKEETCAIIYNSICANADAGEIESKSIRMISLSVTDFLFSGTGGFDSLCAKTVQKLKLTYPDIRCVLVPLIKCQYSDNPVYH